MNRFAQYWSRRADYIKAGKVAAEEHWKKYNPGYAFVGKGLAYYLGAAAFLEYGVGFTICVGPSMMPTIDQEGELALINRFSYKVLGKEYQRGDVVISRTKDDDTKTVCKRVSAIAGDQILHINVKGVPKMMTIPLDHVWLLGDNPSNSNDSRYYGPMPVSKLQGKVFLKIGLRPRPHCCGIDEEVKNNNKDEQVARPSPRASPPRASPVIVAPPTASDPSVQIIHSAIDKNSEDIVPAEKQDRKEEVAISNDDNV